MLRLIWILPHPGSMCPCLQAKLYCQTSTCKYQLVVCDSHCLKCFALVCCKTALSWCHAVLRDSWIEPPQMMTRKGIVQHKQLGELLHLLRAHGICSRASLAATWQKDPVVLRRQLTDCIKKGQQQTLLPVWKEALLQASHSA